MASRVLTNVGRLARPSIARPLATTASTRLSLDDSLLNVPETKVTSLKNGLRVATESTPVETATVGIWMDAGSRFETQKNNGVAHFLEHMHFKGTKNRTQQQLEVQIENMGGHLNAYTSREQTVYHARVFKQDVGTAVEILSDILQNPVLDPAAIERERGVILREQKEVEKNIDETIFDHLHGAAYQGTSLGRTILGSSKQIKTLTREDMVEYMQKTYTAPRMILVGSGGVEHEKLVELAEKYFSNLPTTPAPKPEPAFYTGSEIRKREDDMDLAHFAVAVEGVGWSHPDYFPLLILQSAIGSWDRSLGSSSILSSRLAQVLADQNLAQSYMAFNTTYTDTSLWGVYCQSGARTRLDETAFYIMKELIRLSLGLGEAEVQRAKNQLKSTLLFALDGTHAVAEDIGRQLLTFGRRMTPYEIVKRIDAVDSEKLKQVANEYIYDRDPVLVSMGCVNGVPDYNRFRTLTRLRRL